MRARFSPLVAKLTDNIRMGTASRMVPESAHQRENAAHGAKFGANVFRQEPPRTSAGQPNIVIACCFMNW
jgi:hypothetical protein